MIVGVGSDYSVDLEKKKQPTLIPSEQRLRIISALDCVDFTFLYSTYYDLEQSIRVINPDLYVRGDDWTEDFPGKKVLEELNIPIKFISYTKGVSTTEIKKKLR